ncbi:unnamed protein product [Blumeria hordei]|uniref:Uncharacterized protein n=1 Tax=Blumeria hordei TaxID=2867405 RepID=A0A383UHX3_BLUHO|nr:unnamed protein product [Blumeria hordei]
MATPLELWNLTLTDISAICGSISIACWLCVFLPQLVDNFRRGSTDGLSVRFVTIWLAGDMCNVVGAVLQGVLPTMIILAVYYACMDILLLAQIFYYHGFTWSEDKTCSSELEPHDQNFETTTPSGKSDERQRLLAVCNGPDHAQSSSQHLSATHLSPVVPFVPEAQPFTQTRSSLQMTLVNVSAVIAVILIGIMGWYFFQTQTTRASPSSVELTFNFWGQSFGYLCAILYLSSRLPQLLLNYRRKSTEGISMLFFLFACVGNLCTVLSILIYDPPCRAGGRRCENDRQWREYWHYVVVNISWIIGSAGTFLLDLSVFTQFWIYRVKDEASSQRQ